MIRDYLRTPFELRDSVRRGGYAQAIGSRLLALVGVFALVNVVGLVACAHRAAAVSGYDAVVLSDGPVAYWAMHGGSAEPDLTGNGHAGSYRGGMPATTLLPNGDTAVDFNGGGQYLTVPSSSAFSIPTRNRLTWEAWIRPDVLQWSSASDPYGYGYVDFIGKCQDYSPSCEWEGRMYASVDPEGRCNRISGYVFKPTAGLGSGADWQPTCGLLEAGQWLLVVTEYQTATTSYPCRKRWPGTIDVWVDGVEWNAALHRPTGCMSQYRVRPQAGLSPLDIGTMAFDTWWPGAVGKVAIYGRLLSQAEIAAHYQAMTGVAPSGSCTETCTIP